MDRHLEYGGDRGLHAAKADRPLVPTSDFTCGSALTPRDVGRPPGRGKERPVGRVESMSL